ncbi:MAG: hypothetical protein ACRDK3_14050 [Actinomycetota bacterium]
MSLLGLGAALRALAWAAYQPAIIVLADSNGYLRTVTSMAERKQLRPALYPAFLKSVLSIDSLALVTALQHVFALLMAAGLYWLLLRLDVHPVVAALGMTPLLLDAYQINLEQHILAEALFQTFIAGGILLLAWSARRTVWATALAGASFSFSALTRFVGLAVAPVAVLYLLARKAGWARLGAVLLGILVPLAAYSAWNRGATGEFGLTDRNDHVLYAAKVSRFADCRGVSMPEVERQLCIDTPVSERADLYPPWNKRSPLSRLEIPDGIDESAVVGSFTRRMIRHQPLDYARLIVTDFAEFFAWRSPVDKESLRVTRWQFFEHLRQVKGMPPALRESRGSPPAEYGIEGTFEADPNIGSFLRGYQHYAYQSGFISTILAVLGLLGGTFGLGLSKDRDTRIECLFITFTGLSLVAFPAVLSTFHYRYVIGMIPFLGPAGALGASLLWRRGATLWRARKEKHPRAGGEQTEPVPATEDAGVPG